MEVIGKGEWSLSLYTMLKLSKTLSPKKLFDYDCVTLYVQNWVLVLIQC